MNFPTIGVIGAGQLARMMLGPATGLGINVKVFASAQEESNFRESPGVKAGSGMAYRESDKP